LDARELPSATFVQTNLSSDLPDLARQQDLNLLSPIALAVDTVDPTDRNFGFAIPNALSHQGLVFGLGGSFRRPNSVDLGDGAPTGAVFNSSGSTTDFLVTGAATKPAAFLFANASGQIVAWNPNTGEVDDVGNVLSFSLTGHVEFTSPDAAVYFGLALGKVGNSNFLYAADLANGKIDVIDGQFHKVALGTNGFESFADPGRPAGYTPDNIQNINGKLYVTFTRDGTTPPDPVAGRGFVDVFETNGHFDGRLVSGGDLNNPYGLALAPAGFGDFGGALLVGNISDGLIHAYNPTTGIELGTLTSAGGKALAISNLHGLAFGGGAGKVGDANTLYFTADLDDGQNGLFGSIAVDPGTAPKVASVIVNGGAAQRSLVTQLQVTFDQHVNLPADAADAFHLSRISDGAGVNLTAAVDDFGAATVVTFDFIGGAVEPATLPFSRQSLADGRYQLTVLSAEVDGPNGALDGAGTGIPGVDYHSPADTLGGGPGQLRLYRLFGDANGDGVVDPVDLNRFRSTFNVNSTSPLYVAFLDANQDNVVDPVDLDRFRLRFNTNVFG
jgi:uncharacterized protein (TIGR03118 family)